MLKFSSILIGVKDLTQAKIFYESLLDIKFNEFRPPFASFIFDGVEFNIEEDAEYRSQDWGKNYIGGRKPFSFETDDLEKFLIYAKSLGAIIIREINIKPWGYKEAIIADLDGNEFIIEEEILEK